MNEQREFRRSFIASLTLHSLLFLALMYTQGGGNGEGGTPPPPIMVELTEGEEEEKVQEIVDKSPPMPDQVPEKDCEDWFGGIGITHGPDGLIFTVHAGYPAEAAGIKSGDILDYVNSDTQIKGPVGTEVKIVVYRDGQVLTFRIIRGKICIGDVKSVPSDPER